jgi:hypothetical protein
MTTLTNNDSLTGRHIDLAMRHVSDGWFPANPEVFARIQSKIASNAYAESVPALVTDLCSDIALLTTALKKLTQSSPSMVLSSKPSPIDFLRSCSYTDLCATVRGSPSTISIQSFDDISEPQARQMATTLMSITATEVLCTAKGLNAELGFSASLLRNLGLLLISWNYPHVFERAVSSVRPGASLDGSISKVLGFTPSMLGIRIAREWKLSSTLRGIIGDTFEGDPAQLQVVEQTARICEIGEALARANNPAQYPTALADWDTARSAIEPILGTKGIQIICDKFAERVKAYGAALPADLTESKLPVNPKRAPSTVGRALLAKNQYVSRCSPEIREELGAVYERIDESTNSREAIDGLIHRVIPKAGFESGCVFLADPAIHKLIPRLRIGERVNHMMRPVDYLNSATAHEPIVAAFRCRNPIVETLPSEIPNSRYCIAGALGQTPAVGVLILEFSEATIGKNRDTAQQIFKAIRQALCDCLRLS